MKIIFFISLAVISISIGCTNKPFQPIPPVFKTWSKPGVNTEEVKNTLIECGFENIGTGFDVKDMRTGKISRNEYVAAEICMEKRGTATPAASHLVAISSICIYLPAIQTEIPIGHVLTISPRASINCHQKYKASFASHQCSYSDIRTVSDIWQVFKTANSMHSCYGTGAAGCTQVEIPMPGGHQGTPEGNAKLIRYEGGVRVDKKNSQNEQRNVP